MRRPPLHLVYLAVLTAVLVRSFFHGHYPPAPMPLAVLIIVPAALTLGSLAVWLRGSRDLRISWAMSVWTLLACVVGFDIYLNTRGQETKVDRILQERRTDPATLPAAIPQGFLTSTQPAGTFSMSDGHGGSFLPLADVSRTRTVYCREAGDYTIYRSDEKGYNNPQGIWSHPISIAMIGDSYIHGACVKPGDDLSSLVRKTYPGTVNLGRGGNGPLSELAILTEYAAPAKPPLVIWFHVDNDLRDLRTEKKSAILMGYLRDGVSRGLSTRTGEIDALVARYLNGELAKRDDQPAEGSPAANALKTVVRTLSFATLRDRVLLRNYVAHDLVLPPSDEQLANLDWDLDLQTLETAKRRVEGWGGRMVVMIIPFQDGHGFLDPARDPRARAYRDRLIQNIKTAGLAYHDLNEDFQRLPKPNDYLADMHIYYGHDNEKGYRVLAKAVTDFIAQTCRTRPTLDCAARP